MTQAKSKKKVVLAALSIVLVLAIAAGITLAYLSTQTETKSNKFTVADANALSAMLTEDLWDGIIEYDTDDGTPIYGYTNGDDPIYGYEDGDLSKPVTDKNDIDSTTTYATFDSEDDTWTSDLGVIAAQDMVPGDVAAKNPTITNIGDKSDAWVASKVSIVYASGENKGKLLTTLDLGKVLDAISVDYDTTNWGLVVGDTATDNQMEFYYKSIVEKGNATEPLFTEVTLSEDTTSEQLQALNEMGGFIIFVEGFAAQSNVADTYDDFVAWGLDNGGVEFENTPVAVA